MSYRLPLVSAAFLVLLTGCVQNNPEPPSSPAEETAAPAGTRSLSFTNITVDAGLGDFVHLNGQTGNKWFPETASGGGAFSDIDSDGDPDILLVSGGPIWGPEATGSIHVYVNDGGTFSASGPVEGLSDLPGYGFGVYSADLDNDGDQDLVYTTLRENWILWNEESRFRATPLQNRTGNDRWSTAAARGP